MNPQFFETKDLPKKVVKDEESIQHLLTIPSVGQRMLKAGFQLVTNLELYQRFACESIERKANKGNYNAVIETYHASFPNKPKELDLEDTKWEDIRIDNKGNLVRLSIMSSFSDPFSGRSHYIGSIYVKVPGNEWKWGTLVNYSDPNYRDIKLDKQFECKVRYVKLDDYIDDVIPERCIEHIQIAQQLGINDFRVAFPELNKVPQRLDPVIVGELGNAENNDKLNINDIKMFEIDMWE